MKFKNIPHFLTYSIGMYALLMLTFFIYRILFLVIHLPGNLAFTDAPIQTAIFSVGPMFDSTTSLYIVGLPALVLLISYFFRKVSVWVYRLVYVWEVISIGFAFAVVAADIPFFLYYNSRITKAVLNWTNDLPGMFKAVFLDSHYLPYIVLYVLMVASLLFVHHLLWKNYVKDSYKHDKIRVLWKQLVLCCLIVFFLFSGLRGAWPWGKKAIRVRDAYFTEDSFINQLGLNPFFTFLDSINKKKISLLKDDVAIKEAQQILGREGIGNAFLAKYIDGKSDSISPNIVIVLMESMSTSKMGYFGNNMNLTPTLDSISRKSIIFTNFYSTGIHTSNGIMASLFGFPAVMNDRPMVSTASSNLCFSGISSILKTKNYQSVFFHSVEENFDNMQSFLSHNGFDKVYSKRDYKGVQTVGPWGVPDHSMFNYALPLLHNLSENKNPFLAVFLTISTHSPYAIPTDIAFNPTVKKAVDRSYQYADWSISQLLQAASKEAWYKNTIFVFVADHGQRFDTDYEMPLSYFHIPLIIYSPKYIKKPQVINGFGSQVDVTPTIMGLLKQSYINNTLGIDLLQQQRTMITFGADYKWACLNLSYYLMVLPNGKEGLYFYKTKSKKNVNESNKQLVQEMKNYSCALLQSAQLLIDKRLVGFDSIKVCKPRQ